MNWIDRQFSKCGAMIACYERGRTWTYNDFAREVDRFEAMLLPELDLVPRVFALRMNRSLEALAAIFAIRRLRQIALPLSLEMPESELLETQRIAGVSYILSEHELRAQPLETKPSRLVDQLSERGHAGLILFSSGTSGESKGMLHDLDAFLNRYRVVRPRSDVTLQLLLADHVGGMDSAFRTFFSGSTLVVPESRTAHAVGEAIERYKVTILPASPTFLNLMLLANVAEKYDCSSLELIAYGAEPMPEGLLARLVRSFPNVDFQQKFGTSETGAIRVKSRSRESLYFRIKDLDVDWRVQADELWLKTSSRILGYLNADESSLEADGWYRTGDLVEVANDGCLRVIGRQSQLINVGGQKVHPAEIERVICEIEGVDACAVFAKPAPVTGSMVACAILTSSDLDLRTWKRLVRTHCRDRLASWKIPVSVELRDQLALTDRLKFA